MPRPILITHILCIRLISSMPSASGLSVSSSEVSASFAWALEESRDAVSPAPPFPLPLPVHRHGHSHLLITPKIAAAAALGENTTTSTSKTHRKLVPEKSKRSIFSMGMGMVMGFRSMRNRKSEERVKDLSDVGRRVELSESDLVNNSYTYAYATGGKGVFEIYLEPSHVNPDMG